jgi:hypothetical protein
MDSSNSDEEQTSFLGSEQGLKELDLESVNIDAAAAATTNNNQGAKALPEIQKPYLIQDPDELEKYVCKNINRQDISDQNLATIDEHFFDNTHKYVNSATKISRYFWSHVDDFVNTRITLILSLSENFSQTVYERLTVEERAMYTGICKLVDEHRQLVGQKIRKEKSELKS